MQSQNKRVRRRSSGLRGVGIALALTGLIDGTQRSRDGTVWQTLAQPPPRQHQSPPTLLSKQEVPAGVAERLRRMRDRRAAYQARRRDAQQAVGRSAPAVSFDRNPPRQPDPATPPRLLDPQR